MTSIYQKLALATASGVLCFMAVDPKPTQAATLFYDLKFFDQNGVQVGAGEFSYDNSVAFEVAFPNYRSNFGSTFFSSSPGNNWFYLNSFSASFPENTWRNPANAAEFVSVSNSDNKISLNSISFSRFGDISVGSLSIGLPGIEFFQMDEEFWNFYTNRPGFLSGGDIVQRSGRWTATLSSVVEPPPIPNAININFRSNNFLTTPQFIQNGLTVTGSDNLLLSSWGLGVAQDTFSDIINGTQIFVNGGESVLFKFDSGGARNISFSGATYDFGGGSMEGFDIAGNSLGVVSFSERFGKVNVSNLFNNQPLSAFRYISGSEGRGRGRSFGQITFEPLPESKSVPEPSTVASLSLLGLGFLVQKRQTSQKAKLS